MPYLSFNETHGGGDFVPEDTADREELLKKDLPLRYRLIRLGTMRPRHELCQKMARVSVLCVLRRIVSSGCM